LTVRPRQNRSDSTALDNLVDELEKLGWKHLTWLWDKDLRVWRATGVWRNQKREGRGSTEVLALSVLLGITPINA
jgi:hypothetical protein